MTMLAIFAFAFMTLLFGENVKTFDKVYVNVESSVEVVKSDECAIEIISNDTAFVNNVRADIRNKVLYIRNERGIKPMDDVKIRIKTPRNIMLYPGREVMMANIKNEADKKN